MMIGFLKMSEIINWEFFKTNANLLNDMLKTHLNLYINDLATTQSILLGIYAILYFMLVSFIMSGKFTLLFRNVPTFILLTVVGGLGVNFGLNDIFWFWFFLLFPGSIFCYASKLELQEYENAQAIAKLYKYIKDNNNKN